MARVQTPADLGELVASLLQPSALTELATLAGCLLLAWGLVRALRGREAKPGSIWRKTLMPLASNAVRKGSCLSASAKIMDEP